MAASAGDDDWLDDSWLDEPVSATAAGAAGAPPPAHAPTPAAALPLPAGAPRGAADASASLQAAAPLVGGAAASLGCAAVDARSNPLQTSAPQAAPLPPPAAAWGGAPDASAAPHAASFDATAATHALGGAAEAPLSVGVPTHDARLGLSAAHGDANGGSAAHGAPRAAPAAAVSHAFAHAAPEGGSGDDDMAYFSQLSAGAPPPLAPAVPSVAPPLPRVPSASAAPPFVTTPTRPPPFGGGGFGRGAAPGAADDDGSSFFDSSPSAAASNAHFGAPPPQQQQLAPPPVALHAAPAASGARAYALSTPARAAHADEDYFDTLHREAQQQQQQQALPQPDFGAHASGGNAAPPVAVAAPLSPLRGAHGRAASPPKPLLLPAQLAAAAQPPSRTASWVTDTAAADTDFFDRIDADDEGGDAALFGAGAQAPPAVDAQQQQHQQAVQAMQQQHSPGARVNGRLSFASVAEEADGGGDTTFFEDLSAGGGAAGEHAAHAASCEAQQAPPGAWQQAQQQAPAVYADASHGAGAAAAAFGGGDGGDAFFEQLGEQPGADAAAQQFDAMHLQQQQQQGAYAQDAGAADAADAWQPDAGAAYGHEQQQQQQQQADTYGDDAAAAAAAQAAASALAAAAASEVPLPEGWVAGYSAEGYLYYFNTANGESSWEHPGGVAVAQPQEVPAGDGGYAYAGGDDAAAAAAAQYDGQYDAQADDAHAAWQQEQQAAQEAAYAAAYGQQSGYEQQPGAAEQQQQYEQYEQQQQQYQQQPPQDAYGQQQHAGAYGSYEQQQQAAYAPAVDAHASGGMGAHAAQPGAPPTFFVPGAAAQQQQYGAAAQQPSLYMPGGAAQQQQQQFVTHGQQPTAPQYMQQGGAAAPWGAAAAAVTAAGPPRSAEEALRSPHGRGPCPAIAFGCGGMLITVLPGAPSYGGLSGTSGPVVARTLASVLRAAGPGGAGESYVSAMETCVGPVGGSGGHGVGGVMAGMGLTRGTSLNDLVRVAEERSARVAAEAGPSGGVASQTLLWGYLRLLCAHKGSLTEEGSTGSGAAELAELLVPAAEAGSRFATLQVAPPDAATTATAAAETERLLLAGRRADAVAAAIAGRLWGPALLLSRGLGERAMFDAAAACIRGTVAAGTPLHTALCMAAGVTSDVGAPNDHGHGAAAAFLSAWRQNLAALAFCRAPGDGAAMVALGDRLWAECGDAGGAHLCYLLAGVPPLPYSPGERVCLVGADHRGSPRTYVTPAAVQRSELLEAALRAANPQSVLPALQPYKLVHAAALAELGHVREALAYVDNAARAIRAAGATGGMEVNAPVFAAIAAGLEERLRANTSAKGASIASGAASKLLGGLSSLFDKGISTIFGEEGHPAGADGKRAGAAAAPAHAGAGMHGPGGAAAFLRSQGAAAAGHRRTGSDASIQSVELDGSGGGGGGGGGAAASAPGTRPSSRAGAVSPSVDDSDARSVGSSAAGGAAMVRSLSSFFSGTFRSKKGEAKLGDSNKFYYDEKLKMWLEEGAKPPPPPEPAAPPPTMIPPTAGPMPPGGNSFSARALSGGGVRSRYVDTFNAGAGGGGPASPAAAPPALPLAVADVLGLPPRPKLHTQQFFVPGAAPGGVPDAAPAMAPPPLADAYTAQQQQQHFAPPPPMQQYGSAPYTSSYHDSGTPATLAAQVDAPPPPMVGYGEMLAEAPQQLYGQAPPQQYAQQAQQLAPPQQQAQQGGEWGELEL
jgi:hypothetical protein